MEIFGIGPLELVLIVLIAIIVLGPKDMMASGKKAAQWLNKLRKSDAWTTTKEVMDIPNQVMKETGLDKEIKEIQNLTKTSLSPSVWTPDALVSNNIHRSETKTQSEETSSIPPVTPDSNAEEEHGSQDKP